VIESHENIRKSQVFLDANPDVEDRAFEQDLDNMIRSAKVKWESKQRREGPEGNEEDRVGKRLRR
jgi:hypothetical protein